MSLEFVARILEENWVEGAEGDDPGIDGRMYPVPEPEIEIEKERSNIRLRTNDHINVVDGGDETYSPMGVGWTHEDVDTVVNIEVRTTHDPIRAADCRLPGRQRFVGTRDADNCEETSGGLKGEVKRILDIYRKGKAEFDLINSTVWRDESDLTGMNHYRGTWSVTLDQRAAKIDPQDPLEGS